MVVRPWRGYVPKVHTTSFRDQVITLQAFPPHKGEPAHLCCPVHTLHIYLDSFRRSNQLFVCFGGQQKVKAVSKQRMGHWIVDAFLLASQGSPFPLGKRAHSTKGVAAFSAFANGASLVDIFKAAGWATPNTFAIFYNQPMEPVPSSVLGTQTTGRM